MTLEDQGFRFCVSPDRSIWKWIHPAERMHLFSDWTDCTDMTDAELQAHVQGA